MMSSLTTAKIGGDAVETFIREVLGVDAFEIRSTASGRNNRGLQITANGRRYFLKSYFHHPDDTRDRLGHDFGFCSYLWERGVRLGPQPISADRRNHFALFEYIDGGTVDVINQNHVDQALEFLRQANVGRFCGEAQQLNKASEACFSVAEHVAAVDRRIQRVGQIRKRDEKDRAARSIVDEHLHPAWQRCRREVLARAEEISTELAHMERCLSPSDFGFHNALEEANGRLRFLDFEYAGWDDPAKLACDFVNQPDMPPSERLATRFLSGFAQAIGVSESVVERIGLLMPLYQIKWSCILLNVFLPGNPTFLQRGASKRRETGEDVRDQQLSKCQWMLDRAERSMARFN